MKIKSKPNKSKSQDKPETSGISDKTIQAREQLFQAVAQQSSDIILLVNREAVVLYENDAVERILGFKADQRIGNKVFDHVHPDDVGFLKDAFNLLFADENAPVQKREVRVQDIDGNWHIFEAGAIHLKRKDFIEGVVVNLRDITERKHAEKALQESQAFHHEREERCQNILNNMEESYYEIDLKGNMTFFNSTAVRKLGYTENEMMGMNFRQYVEKDSHQKVFDAFHEVFLTGEPIQGVDWDIISKAGEKIPVASSISLMQDPRGNPVGFRGIIRDITQRKQAEDALRKSEARYREREERYRNILDNMAEAYYEVDLKGNLTFFNATAVMNLGYTDNIMMGLNFREYVDDENASKVFEAYNKVFLTGEPIKGIDWELITKESGKIRVESSIILIRDVHGKPVGFRGIIRDITERKLAEEALRESEEKFRNLTETAQDAIVTTNMNGMIIYANPAAKALARGKAVVGMSLKDFLPPDSVEHHYDQIFDLLSRGFSETLSYESKIMKSPGDDPLYFDVKSSTLWNRGEPSGILLVARDATERKRTEEEIRMMAIIDPMTGLLNRRGFISLAEQQMKAAVRACKKMLLFFIDLDGLKFINDTWGHEEGDHALKKTSAILKNTFRESDIVARLGGDEFAALVYDSPELPEVIMRRLQCRTDEECAASDLPYIISMSIGVADYDPSVPCSIHELMYEADQLMYNQKKSKKQAGKYPV